MTDALRKELPRMLEEHKRIRAATEKLRIAAREEKAPAHEQLAETLAAHAQTEEEVLYQQPSSSVTSSVRGAQRSRRTRAVRMCNGHVLRCPESAEVEISELHCFREHIEHRWVF